MTEKKSMTETRKSNKYQQLRTKSPSESRSRKSKSRNSKMSKTPNADLLMQPRDSEPQYGSFMIKAEPNLDQSVAGTEPMYVDDNCENQNPNQLRDPRLTQLEDENRFLKEQMKK